jgi:glycosyltransferase involved in cell wall biosynthesis
MTATPAGAIHVLELRSVRGTGGGPEKTILLGTAQASRDRFDVTVCYLRDMRDDVFAIDAWAAEVGVPYVEVRERHSFDPGVWRPLRTLVRDRRIDIVHAHDYKTNFIAWLLGKATTALPLSTVHGWTGHSWRERWVYYPADKRVLSRFPHLVAVSDDIRRELIRHGAKPARVTTILNGIDATRFRRQPALRASLRESLGVRQDAILIGAVGRLEPQKRFDLLLDVVAELVRERPNVAVVIVGEGSVRTELESHIARLSLGGHVTLTGHRSDIVALHSAFDLFVQSSDYEGTPNAVLEAMALETPIVATDVGGTSEVARHEQEALIVPGGDRSALRAAIDLALADRDGRLARATRARHRVETELSFSARMARLEAIYVQLMRERRAESSS